MAKQFVTIATMDKPMHETLETADTLNKLLKPIPGEEFCVVKLTEGINIIVGSQSMKNAFTELTAKINK